MTEIMPMDLADVVRRLEDVLVVFDREMVALGDEPVAVLSRMKLVALLLDVSRAEVAGREEQ